MRRLASSLLLVIVACGGDGPGASINSDATGCSEITAEVITRWDFVLDQIDSDPTLMPADIPETEVISERSFDLGFACGIEGEGVRTAFSEIVIHLNEEADVRPAPTAVIIGEMIDGICDSNLIDWNAEAQNICDS